MAGKDRLKFFVELVDKITAPADKASKSVASLEKSLKSAGRERDALGRFTGKTSFLGMSVDMNKVKSAAKGALDALGMVAAAGAAVGGVVIGGGMLLAKTAIDAASFKRNMLASFELMLGSREEAARVYTMIDAFADTTPFEGRDVFATFKTLKGAGLNVEEAKRTMAGIFDIASLVDPSRQKNAIDSITLAIAKVQGEGKLTGEAFNMMTEATDGFAGKGLVLEEIAKVLGKTKDQAADMISKGLVPAKDAIEAYLQAVSKGTGQQGGALGGAMEKFGAGSLEGQLSTVKSRIDNLFENIDLSPLIDALKVLNDVLKSGPAIDALKATFTGMATEAGAGLKELFTPDNIAKFITAVGQIISLTYELSKAFGSGAWKGFMDLMGPVVDVFKDGSSAGLDWKGTLEMIGRVLGVVTAIFVYGFAIIGLAIAGVGYTIYAIGFAVAWVVDKIAAFIAWIVTGNMWEDVKTLGANIVNGIWSGIQGAWGTLKAGWNSLVSTLPDTVSKTLQIHSPSRVMMKLGMHTVDGFTAGIDAANSNASGPGSAMATAAAAAPAAAASSGGQGGGGGGIVINVSVTVNASPGMSQAEANAQGKAIGDAAAAQLASVLEGLAKQVAA